MAQYSRDIAVHPRVDEVDAVANGRAVIRHEAAALNLLAETLDQNFVRAIDEVFRTNGRVIVSGIGKSGHVGRKIAATLAATGTVSFFLHAGEAAHGDLGMVMEGDVLLILSNSGQSRELGPLLTHARRLGVPTIAIVSNLRSALARAANVVLALPATPEACPARIAPTTSTTMMLALGDALALAVMRRRGLTRNDLALWHPGGDIGARLASVEEMIDCNDPLPLVRADAPMRDVVLEMTSAGKGVTGVVDDSGALIGVVTDGDLRRAFDQVLIARARDIMTPNPITAPRGMPVEDVLAVMNDAKITVVFVTEPGNPRRPIGIAHIHDLVV